MKKILACALAFMMILSLAACGGKTDPAPTGDNTTDPGTQQTGQSSTTPEPSASEPGNSALSDIPDIMINVLDENQQPLVNDAKKVTMLSAIPAEIKKYVGDLVTSDIHPGDSGYIFSLTFNVAGFEDYKTLTEYYKSLGGTTTEDVADEASAQLKIDFSWGKLDDCSYEDVMGELEIKVVFIIN